MYAIALWTTLVLASATQAALIVETGTLGATGQTSGISVSGIQFIGVRFQLTATTQIQTVGGHFGSVGPAFGNGKIFGAIVELSSMSDFPDSNNLSTADVKGTTVLTLPTPPGPFLNTSADLSSNLSLTLNPGTYAVVFGSQLFGATADSFLPHSGTPIGTPSFFFRNSSVYVNNVVSDVRMFVTGEAVTVAAVPEPTTMAIWGLGALGCAIGGYRRRKLAG